MIPSSILTWRGGRVAEGNGLLNRRRDKISTEGSNPSLSAIPADLLRDDLSHHECLALARKQVARYRVYLRAIGRIGS